MSGSHPDNSSEGGLWQAQAYLARIVLHDLGSPIGTILLYADLLLAQTLKSAARQKIERIREAAARSQALMERLAVLTAARDEAGAPVTLAALVESAQAMLATRLAARGVRLDAEIPAGLPTLATQAPSVLVLLALVISLAAGLEDTDDPGGVVALGATNDGGGWQVRVSGPGTQAEHMRAAESLETGEAPRSLLFAAEAAANALGGRLWMEPDAVTLVLQLPVAK